MPIGGVDTSQLPQFATGGTFSLVPAPATTGGTFALPPAPVAAPAPYRAPTELGRNIQDYFHQQGAYAPVQAAPAVAAPESYNSTILGGYGAAPVPVVGDQYRALLAQRQQFVDNSKGRITPLQEAPQVSKPIEDRAGPTPVPTKTPLPTVTRGQPSQPQAQGGGDNLPPMTRGEAYRVLQALQPRMSPVEQAQHQLVGMALNTYEAQIAGIHQKYQELASAPGVTPESLKVIQAQMEQALTKPQYDFARQMRSIGIDPFKLYEVNQAEAQQGVR